MDRMSARTFWTGPNVLQGFKDAGVVLNVAMTTDRCHVLRCGEAGRVQVGLDVVRPEPPAPTPVGWPSFGCAVGATTLSK